MNEAAVMRVRQYPPALLALGWLLEANDRSTTTSPFEAIEAVQDACSMVSLWSPEFEDELARLERSADERARLAGQWLGLRRDHPWQSPLADRRQLTTTLDGAQPGREPFVLTSKRGAMWFRPARVVETTTEMETAGRRTQWSGGPLGYAGRDQRIWGLRPAREARVYEIRATANWQALVSRYPRLVERDRFSWNNCYAAFPGPFYLPAWDRVAMDWDAVRFTLSGLIDNDFALVEALDGYTMLIDEETGERTIWLRWVFEAVEDLGDASEYFREREPVTIDLPEHVLAHMAKEQQRLVAEATERMNSRTEGQTPPSSFPGKDRRRLFTRIDPPSKPSD